MKIRSFRFTLQAFALATILLVGCRKDNVGEDNEEEVITTVQLTFSPRSGGTAVVYKYEDADGPGGINPTQDQVVLAPNKTYDVTVQLLNKTVTPAEDITMEIKDEAQAHRFYYQPSSGSNITVTGLDLDSDGVPVGIASVWTTANAGTGTLAIVLRHYPGNPPEKATADPVNSPKSSTDVEVEFSTRIQ